MAYKKVMNLFDSIGWYKQEGGKHQYLTGSHNEYNHGYLMMVAGDRPCGDAATLKCTLLLLMVTRDVLLAGECVLVEDLIFAAADQPGMALYARDQPVTVTGHGESREWPEDGLAALRRYGSGTLEADHGLWIADLEQLIGPVAAMDTLVVH